MPTLLYEPYEKASKFLYEKIRLDAGLFRYEVCKSTSDSRVFKPEFEGSVLQYSTENEWRRIPRRWRAIASRNISQRSN